MKQIITSLRYVTHTDKQLTFEIKRFSPSWPTISWRYVRHPHSSSFYQTTLERTTNLITIRVANVFGQPKYSQQIWSLNWLRSKIPTERSGSSLSSHIGISVTISFLFWRMILPLYSSWRYRYCYWRQWPFRRRHGTAQWAEGGFFLATPHELGWRCSELFKRMAIFPPKKMEEFSNYVV